MQNIETEDPVEGVTQLLQALNNPHTAFNKVTSTHKSGFELSQEKQPSYEVIDNVLVIKIPSWNRSVDLDSLNKFLDENITQVEGLIIDVRENQGGSDNPAFKFARRFIPEGNYTYGTFIKRKQEEGLEAFPATIESRNKHPITKPIVILTSEKTFSSCELFVAAMKAGTNCKVIGEATGGGSAFREEYFVEINGDQYSVKIPTRRLILTGESEPIETTHINPDIPYDGKDITGFAVKSIKKLEG